MFASKPARRSRALPEFRNNDDLCWPVRSKPERTLQVSRNERTRRVRSTEERTRGVEYNRKCTYARSELNKNQFVSFETQLY
jgi:hypothetical protein